MIIESGDLRIRLGGGDRWTITLPNLKPGTPSTTRPDTVVQVFRRDVDSPPAASFTIDANENDGTVTITDTSTDAVGLASIDVDWGDGTVDTGLTPGATYMHTYGTTDTYTIDLIATDTSGQSDTASQSVSVTVLWTPAELGADLELWHDSLDASSVTVRTDGGTDFAEQWDDLSGNGRHLTQGTATQQFVYDGTVLTSDGIDDTMLSGLPTGVTYQFFFVVQVTDDAFIFPSDTVDNTRWGWIGEDGSANTTITNYGTTDNLRINATTVFPADRDAVHAFHVTGGAVLVEHDAADLTELANAWTQAQIGGYAGAADFFVSADWSAWIATTTTITSGERDLIEGYLAHRYGIEANLPAGHPYKDNPPTI